MNFDIASAPAEPNLPGIGANGVGGLNDGAVNPTAGTNDDDAAVGANGTGIAPAAAAAVPPTIGVPGPSVGIGGAGYIIKEQKHTQSIRL